LLYFLQKTKPLVRGFACCPFGVSRYRSNHKCLVLSLYSYFSLQCLSLVTAGVKLKQKYNQTAPFMGELANAIDLSALRCTDGPIRLFQISFVFASNPLFICSLPTRLCHFVHLSCISYPFPFPLFSKHLCPLSLPHVLFSFLFSPFTLKLLFSLAPHPVPSFFPFPSPHGCSGPRLLPLPASAVLGCRSGAHLLWRSAAVARSCTGDRPLWRSAALPLGALHNQPVWRSTLAQLSWWTL
jgi:hypothetical protein